MIKKIIQKVAFVSVLFILVSCSSFIPSETENLLKQKYEVPVFTMKKDLEINNKVVLRKGDNVKLILSIKSAHISDSFVKVYAYKYENESSLLKSDRFLFVYMFDNSFKDDSGKKVFDEDKLDKEISEYVKEK